MWCGLLICSRICSLALEDALALRNGFQHLDVLDGVLVHAQQVVRENG